MCVPERYRGTRLHCVCVKICVTGRYRGQGFIVLKYVSLNAMREQGFIVLKFVSLNATGEQGFIVLKYVSLNSIGGQDLTVLKYVTWALHRDHASVG